MNSSKIPLLLILGLSFGCRVVEATCEEDGTCGSTGCETDCEGGETSLGGETATSASTEASGNATETGESDAGTSTSGASESSSGSDDGSTGEPAAGCFDGVLEPSELPLVPGASARFQVAVDATFNSEGVLQDDGSYAWDLNVGFDGDEVVESEVLALEDLWFAESFPGATHALRLSVQSDVLAVFETTDTALMLLGLASADDGVASTLLTYDPPLPFHPLPLTAGASWSSETTASGTLGGLPTTFIERHDATVDRTGAMETPRGSFDVLRINDARTTAFGLAEETTRSFYFLAECVGTVASVRAEDGDDGDEILQASEIWRAAF